MQPHGKTTLNDDNKQEEYTTSAAIHTRPTQDEQNEQNSPYTFVESSSSSGSLQLSSADNNNNNNDTLFSQMAKYDNKFGRKIDSAKHAQNKLSRFASKMTEKYQAKKQKIKELQDTIKQKDEQLSICTIY